MQISYEKCVSQPSNEPVSQLPRRVRTVLGAGAGAAQPGRDVRLLKKQTMRTHPGQERSSSVHRMHFVSQGSAVLKKRKRK